MSEQHFSIPEATAASSKAKYPFHVSRSAGAPSVALAERLSRSFDSGPVKSAVVERGDRSLDEMLFDTLADYKVHLAMVAMHLSKEDRIGLHKQLDNLLDVEDWDERDPPPSVTSFKTFVRLILSRRPVLRPSIGASAAGEIIAAWVGPAGRITIECRPNDNIRWSLVSKLEDGRTERAAGESRLDRLTTILAPYGVLRLMDRTDG